MSWYFPASFYQSCAHLPCLHPVSRPPQDEASLSQQGTEHRHSLLMPGRALWTEFIGQTARDLVELTRESLSVRQRCSHGAGDIASASPAEFLLPVVVGASEAERRFIGVHQLVAVVKSLRDMGGPPISLNADHTHSLSGALEAAKAGFDWVVCDFSSLPFDDNLRQRKEAVVALKELRPDILVEGEIGDIGSGSQIHDSAPHRPLTTPDEAMQFVQETAIDTLVPAVGNMHGVLKSMLSGDARKHLNIERIRAIKVVAARLALFSGRESQT